MIKTTAKTLHYYTGFKGCKGPIFTKEQYYKLRGKKCLCKKCGDKFKVKEKIMCGLNSIDKDVINRRKTPLTIQGSVTHLHKSKQVREFKDDAEISALEQQSLQEYCEQLLND